MKKSELTKKLIYDRAIEKFAEDGFENTTIRDLSKDLKISLGSLYYHFKSKDDILLHFFRGVHIETVEQTEEILNSKKASHIKVKTIIWTTLEILKQNERLARDLINSTTNVSHPLSPFGLDLQDCQRGAIGLFSKALDHPEKPTEYQKSLAFLYWFYCLGFYLCWANDLSEGQKNSKKLFDISFPLVQKLAALTALGLGRKMLVQISKLLQKILLRWEF